METGVANASMHVNSSLLRVPCNPCNPELGTKFFQFQATRCSRHLSRSNLCLYGECPRDALLLHLKDLNLFLRYVHCSLVVRCYEADKHLLAEGHLNQNQPALQLLEMYSCTYKRYMQPMNCKVDNTEICKELVRIMLLFRSFHRSFPIQFSPVLAW